MDFKQFYLSADGRVNRKQWWLYLILRVRGFRTGA